MEDDRHLSEEEFDRKMAKSIRHRHPEFVDEPIHRYRWTAMVIWCVIFTFFVFWGIRSNRQNISEQKILIQQVQHNKADISSLRRTNCGLRFFLLDARKARLKSAATETGTQRQTDLKAAKGYLTLAKKFSVDGCVHHP